MITLVNIVVIVAMVGLILCMNPLRRPPTYGANRRASIRNLRNYERQS